MSGFLLNVGATLMCPHGATVNAVTSNARVMTDGQPVTVLPDTFPISPGCPFQVPVGAGTKPQPCVQARWVVPATRVFVSQQPALLQSSTGICQSAEQIPQGAPNIIVTQMRVRGT